MPGASLWDQLQVDLVAGGRIDSEKRHRAKGHADRPLSAAELFEKIRGGHKAGGPRIARAVLFDRIRTLERLFARAPAAAG